MNVLGRGLHGTAIQWPGFSEDAWPQELIDFFGTPRENITPSIIQAVWVGGTDGHYDTQVKTLNGWAPLPDGAYLVKFAPAQGGALWAFDPDSFTKLWKIV